MQPHELISEYGNCREVDVGVMYPNGEDTKGIALAKMVCADCVVKEICLQQAMFSNETIGVWGGMTPKERDNYKRKLQRNGKSKRTRTL